MATAPKHPLATIALAAIAPVWLTATDSQVLKNKPLPTLEGPHRACDAEARSWAFLPDSSADDQVQPIRGDSAIRAEYPAIPPGPRVGPGLSGSIQPPIRTTRVIATAPKQGPPEQPRT